MGARALSLWGAILEGWLAPVVALQLLQHRPAWAVALAILACLVDATRRRHAARAGETAERRGTR